MTYHTLSEPELHGEPTLEELFAEPIVRLIMQRDGVKEREMRGQIDRVQSTYRTLAEVQ